MFDRLLISCPVYASSIYRARNQQPGQTYRLLFLFDRFSTEKVQERERERERERGERERGERERERERGGERERAERECERRSVV